MTTQSGRDSAPGTAIMLDAVASHLRRRGAYADDEALMLAVTVRDLAAENAALRARIVELENPKEPE